VLNKEIPFLRIVVPLCLGILSGSGTHPGIILLTVILVIGVSGLLASLFFNKYIVNIIYGLSLSLLLFIAGHLLYKIEKGKLSVLEPVSKEYICTISDYPDEKANSYSITARLNCTKTGEETLALHGSILFYFRKDPEIESFIPGDVFRVRCTPAEILNRGNPDEFNYRFYMENHGIKYSAFSGIDDITGYYSPKHRKLIHQALITRKRILSMYEQRGIKGDTLAIVAAITLGQKNMLDQEQKLHFMKAGIMHLMAVSGLHAFILSMFVFNLLFFLKRKLEPLRSVIAIFFLISFAFITGLTPSVLRATIMFTFLQGSKHMKRNVNSLNSVFASAFILLLIRPSVLFDTGFLLSYSAVIFIISFYRGIYIKLDFKNIIADRIWQSAAVSTVAQAGTLPLTIMVFNRFPTWFLITNIVIVPVATILIILGCLVPLTFPVHFISIPLAKLLGILTGITGLMTEKAASLPFSSLENIGMVPAEAILLSLFIFIFFRFITNRRNVSVLYPSIVLLLFLTAGTIKKISCRMSDELIVYNSFTATVIGIRTGDILNIYSDTTVFQPEVLKHIATRGLKLRLVKMSQTSFLLKAGENRILITSYPSNGQLEAGKPDIIIIMGPMIRQKEIINRYEPVKATIITGNIPFGTQGGEKIFRTLSDTLYYPRKSGAVRIKI
jgi:competence protein ComEC